MIKNLLFDLGGVLMTIDSKEALRRFESRGLKNAAEYMDSYTQKGIFGQLEEGKISDAEFAEVLGKLTGKPQSLQDCKWMWLGYKKDVPQRNLDALKRLRAEGYRLALVSNTNSFMQSWAESDFDGKGGSIRDYFDALYRSYEMGVMKPDETFFRKVLSKEKAIPDECLFIDDSARNCAAASELGLMTYCPENGKDWTKELEEKLKTTNG